MSYWIYQHVGNLSPDEQDQDGLLDRLQHLTDGTTVLREYARGSDREAGYSRWSFHRDVGRTRVVVIDSRCGRQLEEGNRSMLDEDEWQWVEDHATGGFDHLLIATSLPWLLGPGMHHLEAWNEAVCAGAWGGLAAKLGEKIRQDVDLEHWAAFNESFERLAEIQRAVGAGERGEAAGHHRHPVRRRAPRLPERGRLPARAGVRSAVYQAVCSPMRNPLDGRERRAIKSMFTRPVAAHHPLAGPRRGRVRPLRPLAPGGRRPLLRQPAGHAGDRRPPDRPQDREGAGPRTAIRSWSACRRPGWPDVPAVCGTRPEARRRRDYAGPPAWTIPSRASANPSAPRWPRTSRTSTRPCSAWWTCRRR